MRDVTRTLQQLAKVRHVEDLLSQAIYEAICVIKRWMTIEYWCHSGDYEF